ncbi:MAG: hypothetical protein U5N53_14095 [Mycobacterium sp.]|nr:hypothetical protein [Mycobacterium sp.]
MPAPWPEESWTNLSEILPTADKLTAEIPAVLPDLLTTLFNSADLTDSDGNFQLGNLLDLVGLSLETLADSGALSMTYEPARCSPSPDCSAASTWAGRPARSPPSPTPSMGPDTWTSARRP